MAETGNRAPEALTDAQATEQKMRRALGLNTKPGAQTPQQRPEQARARHRFVQDGGVPVTVLNPRHDSESKERIAALEHQLELERQAHATTRRALSELQTANQALETRLVHADLAHQDALAQERQLRQAAQAALATTPPAPKRNRSEPPAVTAQREPPASTQHHTAAPDAAAKPKPKRGRPRLNPIPEPKPVRWWTPSFRAKR